MNEIKKIELYQSEFRTVEKESLSVQPDFLRKLRRRAMERFLELGFPTTRMEGWRNTNVESIANTPFRLPTNSRKRVDSLKLTPYLFENIIGARVVILNGRFSTDLPSFDHSLSGAEIRSLSWAIHHTPEKLIPYLGQIVNYHDHPFVALNTAFMDDGVFLYIPENQVIDHPIHLLFVASPPERETVFHQRNLIWAAANSHAIIVEHYVGLGKRSYFTNAVTEIMAENNASIYHIKLQEESPCAHHISTTHFHLQEDSSVSTIAVSIGGLLVRNDVNAILDGEGSECVMNGLVLTKRQQHVDNHTMIDHAKPHSSSKELYKGIHHGKSHGVFNGRIVVRKNSQKSKACQTNKNLLLSETAQVNSNPQLEIYADDVKCTHASSTGQIEEEALFYLRSRGIDAKTAQALMVIGFANEIIDEVSPEQIRKRLRRVLSNWSTDRVKM